MRAFAVGKMAWSMQRYKDATLTEYIIASKGYWLNWEQNTVWLAREIMYTNIAISPYVPKGDKPTKKQLFTLDMDKKPIVSIEDTIEKAREFDEKLKHNLNG